MNCAQAYPSLPDPQDIQKPYGPGVRAPDPRFPGVPSPRTGHSLGEGVALFKVLPLIWGERRPRRLKGPRGKALRAEWDRVVGRGRGLRLCGLIF